MGRDIFKFRPKKTRFLKYFGFFLRPKKNKININIVYNTKDEKRDRP